MRKIYVQINGELVEKQNRYTESSAPMIMPDIQPYKSMADGSIITSRSHHREHLRKHNCIEIGNEKMETKPVEIKSNRKEILRAQLANMTHSEANKILAKVRDDLRFNSR